MKHLLDDWQDGSSDKVLFVETAPILARARLSADLAVGPVHALVGPQDAVVDELVLCKALGHLGGEDDERMAAVVEVPCPPRDVETDLAKCEKCEGWCV